MIVQLYNTIFAIVFVLSPFTLLLSIIFTVIALRKRQQDIVKKSSATIITSLLVVLYNIFGLSAVHENELEIIYGCTESPCPAVYQLGTSYVYLIDIIMILLGIVSIVLTVIVIIKRIKIKNDTIKQLDHEDINNKGTITLKLYGLLALFLGIFGLHDFATRQWMRGLGHLALTVCTIVLFTIGPASSPLPPLLLALNMIIAIVELIIYRKAIKRTNPPIYWHKSFWITSVVANVLLVIVIVLAIIFVWPFANQTSNPVEWLMPVIVTYIGFVPTIAAFMFTKSTFSHYAKLPNGSKKQFSIKLNLILTSCLAVVCVLFIVGVILVAIPPLLFRN